MRRALLRSGLRLFTVQGSWNYDRLVGIGIAYALEPLLARLPGGRGGERYRRAMARGAQYFNTHPYLAGLAVGAEARAEHDGEAGERIERFRHALVAPLGSLGDQIVWVGVLPASVAVGLVLAVAVHPLLGVAACLVAYNAVHLALRAWALAAGWRYGARVAQALRVPWLRAALRGAGPLAALTLGFALPVVGAWLMRDFAPAARAAGLGVALLALILTRWMAPILGGLRFGVLVVFLAGVVGLLWP